MKLAPAPFGLNNWDKYCIDNDFEQAESDLVQGLSEGIRSRSRVVPELVGI